MAGAVHIALAPPRGKAPLLVAAALAMSVALAWWHWQGGELSQPAGAGVSSSAEGYGGQASLLAFPLPVPTASSEPERLQALWSRVGSSGQFSDLQDLARARQEKAIYLPIGPGQMQRVTAAWPNLTARQLNDGRTFMAYNMRTLESRDVGDVVSLPLPGGMTVQAQIERVEVIDGLLRWQGRISDSLEGGRFTITHATSDGYAVGTLQTPMGNFSLEVRAGFGWVVDHAVDFVMPEDGDDVVHEAAPAQPTSR